MGRGISAETVKLVKKSVVDFCIFPRLISTKKKLWMTISKDSVFHDKN
jgi:hypothetical protein